ncbi:hypothetical protein DFH11DRAFT_363652 [Phellopilus nigrolimitatus]|nr:hypothetical protein DFH11DRAFT_363652 [Phellopilus nigrolimitatus]
MASLLRAGGESALALTTTSSTPSLSNKKHTMSAIAHISRPTSGIAPIELSNIEDDDEQDRGAAIGVALSCDDMSGAGDELRLYSFYKTQHKAIDLVRATVIKPATISAAAAVALGGTVRATFSSPVMSRRHAHIAFSENGLITISDTGSLHGTYIQTSSGTLAKLTPHRPYVLHSGNVVLLGKSVYRDDRYWKPVIVRVTILHAESGLSASPALGPSTPPPDAQRTPNRYGMYVGSAGVSSFDGDEDVDSMSLSSEDDDSEDISSDSSQRLPSSSPATSPINTLKLGLGLPPCTSGSGSDATNENNEAVAANVTSTTTDGNFSSSSLRAILPFPFNFSLSRLSGSGTGTGTETEIAPGPLHQLPRPQLPFSQFPLLRPLPSLRDLGFFGAAVGRGLNRSFSHSQNDDANTDAYIGTRKVENESGNAEQKLNENENEVQNEPHSAYPFSPVSESDLAHHPYAYASPPSFPENQLGLADAELRFVDDGEDDHDEDVLGYDGRNYKREGSSASCDVDHDEHEYESSNEDAAVAVVSLKLKQHRNVRGRSSIIRTEDIDDAEEAPMEISPSPSRDASPSPRAQHARVVIDVDEIDSQEDEELARPAMVGAWPSEPEPERSLGRSRSGERWPSRIQESISRHNARMLDFLKAQQSTSASSSAPGIASTSMLLPASAAAHNAVDFDELHAVLDDGAREELQGMREEYALQMKLIHSLLSSLIFIAVEISALLLILRFTQRCAVSRLLWKTSSQRSTRTHQDPSLSHMPSRSTLSRPSKLTR